MAAIFNSPNLVSAILHKKLHCIHSHWTWWWQPYWILPTWIQPLPYGIQTPCFLVSDTLKNTLPLTLTLTKTNSFCLKPIHSHSTWWWQPSWILPSWIQTLPSWNQPSWFFLSNIHSYLPRLVPLLWFCTETISIWLKLIDSDSPWWWWPSWILPCWIQLLASVELRHLVFFSQIHSKTLSL